MFFLILRELVVLLIAVVVIWGLWKQAIKIKRRGPVEDALENIQDTVKLAKELPKINQEELTKAKKKVEETKQNG